MRRNQLFVSTAILALLPFSEVAAQTVSATDDQVIVVTGTALARERAIGLKRDDNRIIEALGSDELGQFPDKNIGESLNRLPGVSILVEKGEGRYVQIRGVAANLNNVTINGLQMGSPEVEDGGRQAPLDVISAGVLSRVEVIKTRSPDMDGQGIGGTVNVVTLMPFDRRDAFYGRVTGRIGYEETRPRDDAFGGHDPYAIDAMLSGKAANDTLGWLIGATWSDREYVGVGLFQDDWDETSGIPLPINVKNNYYVIGRERLNINGALEWRPGADHKLFLRGFYSRWDEFRHRNRYEQNLSAGVVPAADGISGVSGPNRVAINVRLENAEKQIFTLAGGGESRFDALTLDYVVQYNRNQIDEPNTNWEWRSSARFGPNRFSIAPNGIVGITPDAGTPDRQDPSLFPLRRVRFTEAGMTEESGVGAANLAFELNPALVLKGGVKYARTTRNFDRSIAQFDPGAQPLTLGTTADLTDSAFINQNPFGSAPNLLLNIDAANAFFADPANAAFFNRNTGVQLGNDFGADYGVRETVLAGYAMGTFTTDAFDLIGGVRVERTSVNSSGFLLSNGTAEQVNADGDYTTWLPSLIGTYRPLDGLVLRAGVTRALGRPGFNAIAPASSLSLPSTVIGVLSIGNPGLQARTAWSYDASIEYYPNRLSSFAVALFQKDIDDDFVRVGETFIGQSAIASGLTARGLSINDFDVVGLDRLTVNTTINAGSSRLQGIEFSAQTQLAFLPSPLDGFGVSGSATFLKGRTVLVDGTRTPVQGQPKRSYAASLFYQMGGLDAAISYSFNDSFLTDLNDDPDLVLDQGAYGKIDARISYDFGGGFKVFAEGINLTNEPTSEFQGGREEWNTEYETVGRTFFVGAGFSF